MASRRERKPTLEEFAKGFGDAGCVVCAHPERAAIDGARRDSDAAGEHARGRRYAARPSVVARFLRKLDPHCQVTADHVELHFRWHHHEKAPKPKP